MVTKSQIAQAKRFPIYQILLHAGHEPAIEAGNQLVYYSPFTDEHTPSCYVEPKHNVYNDFSSGKKGDAINIYRELTGKGFIEAVNNLVNNTEIDYQTQQRIKIFEKKEKFKPALVDVLETVKDRNLLTYLASREIQKPEGILFLREIHYMQKNGKIYKSIGFKNDSGGYELRSANFKACLGHKDITLHKLNGKTDIIAVFEGFFNFLSFIELGLHNRASGVSAFLILNSNSLIEKGIKIIRDYGFADLYLDNDASGLKNAKRIADECENSYITFPGSKIKDNDLNDYLIRKRNAESRKVD